MLPTMWAYDMSRFMYGALFMLGAGYALSKGVHIRADFLYRNFKTKNSRKNRFLVISFILFSRTLSVFLIYDDRIFVQESIMRGERGMDTAMDAIYVANKSLFMVWNNIFISSGYFRII